MSWDNWTWTVLGLLLVSLVRPGIATVLQRHSARVTRARFNPGRAGGGAAMLMLAGYLISDASRSANPAYWNLLSDALHDSFVRSLPILWVPILCWAIMTLAGLWWLYAGIVGYRGPRNPMTAVWALNEVAIFVLLLVFGIYIPAAWPNALFINFALKGLYLSFAVGALLRLVLVLINPGGNLHAVDPRLERPGTSWLGRMRRY